MNTEHIEKFVNAIACDLEEGGFRQVSGTTLRRSLTEAVSAALPLLEAGNPVSELAEQQDTNIVSRMRNMLSDIEQLGAAPMTVDTNLIRDAIAALAATGKQQVGEVQGDARAQFEAWWKRENYNRGALNSWHGSGYNNVGVNAAWASWNSALAARQPGAQERVAWASTGATGHKVVAMPGLHKLPYGDYDLYAAPAAQAVSESVDDDWHLRGYTYASKQATTCAGCGKHQHTPLRIDAMGGYVCLTCIDQKLGALLGEFGYSPAQGIDLEPMRTLVAAVEKEFCCDATEENEPDDSKVSYPEETCPITFGMIRAARRAIGGQHDAAPGVE